MSCILLINKETGWRWQRCPHLHKVLLAPRRRAADSRVSGLDQVQGGGCRFLWLSHRSPPGPGGGQRRTAGGNASREESEYDRWRSEHRANIEGKEEGSREHDVHQPVWEDEGESGPDGSGRFRCVSVFEVFVLYKTSWYLIDLSSVQQCKDSRQRCNFRQTVDLMGLIFSAETNRLCLIPPSSAHCQPKDNELQLIISLLSVSIILLIMFLIDRSVNSHIWKL